MKITGINKKKILIFLAVALICLSISYSIVYTAVQTFSKDELGGNTDAVHYMEIYRGEGGAEYWRFRILVPFLAGILPDPPAWIFSSQRELSDFWVAKIKFGIINLGFLFFTGILFFYYLQKLGLSKSYALLGLLFFYTSRPVLQGAGISTVEASAYFFLLLGFYAILARNMFLLFLAFLLGVLSKETSTFILFFAALFAPGKNKMRMVFLLGGLFIVYSLLRMYLTSQANIFNIYTFNPPALPFLVTLGYQLSNLFSFNKAMDLFSSFSLIWILAIVGFINLKTPLIIRSLSWIILIILGKIFLLGGNFGRILFFAFPVVIPAALFGLKLFLGTADKAEVEQ